MLPTALRHPACSIVRLWSHSCHDLMWPIRCAETSPDTSWVVYTSIVQRMNDGPQSQLEHFGTRCGLPRLFLRPSSAVPDMTPT